jgi:hypothetical protein
MRFASAEVPEEGLLSCDLASVRLRAAVAALEWRRSGNENVFCDPAATGGSGRLDWKTAQVCVVAKYLHDLPLQPWLDACRAAKRNGCGLVIDICDNPFTKPPPVPTFYSEALRACDAVVVNSQRMGELMAAHAAHHPLIIEDAILGSMRTPEFAPADRVELLWFGHRINLPYLEERLADLLRFSARRRVRLTVVTQDDSGAREWTEGIQSLRVAGFVARFVPWSLESLRTALRQCDIVLIPSDPSDPLKAGASANRIAEALNAGRFPVASPIPSYLAFRDAAWLGQDLVAGITWALANRPEVLARIRRGQALIRERLAADQVGRQWRELLGSLVATPIRSS